MEPRLLRHYREYARPKLAEQFQWSNPNQIPKIEKIVLNVGVGEASKNAKLLAAVVDELGVITGQKAVVTRARRSVSTTTRRCCSRPRESLRGRASSGPSAASSVRSVI